jgi:HTH-type transcriptional regulator/antitoxin HigA
MPNTAKQPGKSDTVSSLTRLQKTSTWHTLQPLMGVAQSKKQYEQQLAALRELMLTTPDSKDNPFNGWIESLAMAVEAYEARLYPIEQADPVRVLKALMLEHGLRQCDLPEIGNQAKVSEVLSGKRHLNVGQIKGLCKRFNLNPSVFMG